MRHGLNALILFVILFVLPHHLLAADIIIPSPPQLAATAYMLIDADTGTVLADFNSEERLSPASLTKMMTSYVVAYEIERGNFTLDDPVKVSAKARRMEGSRMFIEEGSIIRLEELLRGIIIQSGNDASIAVAEHVAGSEEIFADLMNQHAKRLGLEGTNFQNATGLYGENHYSTSQDLAKIAINLINDFPDHYAMYREKYYEHNGTHQRNRNSLLWRDDSVDGVKTGKIEEAGYCLVASAVREGMRLVSVVMGTRSESARTDQSQKLLNYGFRYYKTDKIYGESESLVKVKVWGGTDSAVDLGVREDVLLTIPKGSREDLKVTTKIDEVVYAPVKEDQPVGTLSITLNEEPVYQGTLVVLRSVGEGGFFSGLWDSIALFFVELVGADPIKI